MAASSERASARGSSRGRAAARKPAARNPAARRPAARKPAARRGSTRKAAPRRSGSRRGLSGLSVRAMVVALLALVVVLGLMAAGPYSDYTAARDRVEDLSVEQQALTEAVEALESEQARLEDPRSLEEEARDELGLTRPGEIPYIVVNPPTEDAVGPDPNAAAVPSEDPSLVERVLQTVAGWLDG